MVNLFRIDFRLLHFQTSQVWPQKMGCNQIVIANDNVAKDQLRISLMKMSAPHGIKLKICSIEEAVAYMQGDEGQQKKIELIVDSPKDAYEIVNKIDELKEINVALLKGGEGKKMVSPSLNFSTEDEEYLKKMLDLGIKLESYVAPDDRKVSIEKYL
ncbi:PTS system mannose/fructose/N-acetylgalactosamine-transporter subunit IIB [Anaerorhabdus sp.]|uniref:PTS system mannose/fructose/N-acetylgalactosamine-transporter subunit IIB n=1 Tax=Anaerorhabdus sp. TaxID=1872524 RepID=UPI002FC6CC2B